MTEDIRVVPFTDEEKARLNEKVQKMKFSRPPPKLPTARLNSKTATPHTTSLSQSNAEEDQSLREKDALVDDSGISSCGSEKEATPGFRCSPVDLLDEVYQLSYSKYVCDGDDWVQDISDQDVSPNGLDNIEEHISTSRLDVTDFKEDANEKSIDAMGINKDFSLYETCDRSTTVCNKANVDLPLIHPVEVICATSPIVYSQRLQSTLNRDRGDLLGIPLRGEEKIGRFENPTYGRLLLTKNFPVESMRHIMDSAIRNLTSYFTKQKLKPSRIVKKSKSNISASNSSTLTCVAKAAEKENIVGVKPKVNGVKLRKKKGMKKEEPNEFVVGVGPMQSLSKEMLEAQKAVPKDRKEEGRGVKKRRKRKLSVVSTTSDGPRKSFKIVIRRDVPIDIVNSSQKENSITFPSVTNDSENVAIETGEPFGAVIATKNVSNPVDLRGSVLGICGPSDVADVIFQQENIDRDVSCVKEDVEENAIGEACPLVSESTPNRAPKIEEVEEDDIVIVHENIKSKRKSRRELTIEESLLVTKLATLLKIESVNIRRSNWFAELLSRAQQFEEYLDRQIRVYWKTKLELGRCRGYQIAERNRYRFELHKQRSDTMTHGDGSINASNTIAPGLPSPYNTMPSYMTCSPYLPSSSASSGMHYMQTTTNEATLVPVTRHRCRMIIGSTSQPEDIPRDPMPSSCTVSTSQEVASTSTDLPSLQVTSVEDLRSVAPVQMSTSLTTRKRPQDTHVIAKRTPEYSKPRYIFKNGVCYERKYEIAAAGCRVGSLIHRRDLTPF